MSEFRRYRTDTIYEANCPRCGNKTRERRPVKARRFESKMSMTCPKCGCWFMIRVGDFAPVREARR